ncbi:Acetyltransferase involved in cellulose biosynthesis, CelD/BcsL family [Mesorhizobium albiziae]|uniref:Acetyltransferase involved in cellulose biosynthesis, CelD/BcsL family n=1 Tax=Neomesorhizobium albiziae TaxID=335020 RepID=A0A1I3YMU3_9HYPH|nr:GNAT family N-acetyltransferase [Mesorhizobium albiziae]GLS33401.1 acetyltransferase [Mesorhizobium albiziae]SFK33134.1 Acetyltransferase involved in cellulose biosynthesis, CelD/BcsL family [Mesorhizobium albiziae]
MVDASSEAATGAASGRTPDAAPKATVHLAAEDAIDAYRAACADAVVSPAQSFAWINAWVASIRPDFLVAALDAGDGPAFAIALEVTRSGPCRVARFMSGRHANGNFPPLPRKTAQSVTPGDLDAIVAAIRVARPDVDMLAFERLADRMEDRENPLLALPHSPSANLSLGVDLAGGFDELLDRANGKRKRKKHRSQVRKFEAAGGFRRIEAKTPTEATAMLDAFFVMKEDRFREMGITNVFGEPSVRSFFRALFAEALAEEEPAFLLHGLEIGGRLRAVTGSSRAADRLICEFGSIAKGDLGNASPGDFLFFDNIREACEKGFAIYDFSVGDEPYKRLWCDIETTHFDVFVPLTVKGRLMAASMRATSRLKSAVKKSPTVWRIAKALRRRGSAPAHTQDD